MLLDAADGVFPPVDGLVETVPPYVAGVEAIVCFTGHAVVATALPRAELVVAGADGFVGASLPSVVAVLAGAAGGVDVLDALLVARGTGGGSLPARPDLADHPRVRHARGWRHGVRVFGDERGLVTLARGVGGVCELSFEVAADRRGRGHGRALLREGRALVPAGEPRHWWTCPAATARAPLRVPSGACRRAPTISRPGSSTAAAGSRSTRTARGGFAP